MGDWAYPCCMRRRSTASLFCCECFLKRSHPCTVSFFFCAGRVPPPEHRHSHAVAHLPRARLVRVLGGPPGGLRSRANVEAQVRGGRQEGYVRRQSWTPPPPVGVQPASSFFHLWTSPSKGVFFFFAFEGRNGQKYSFQICCHRACFDPFSGSALPERPLGGGAERVRLQPLFTQPKIFRPPGGGVKNLNRLKKGCVQRCLGHWKMLHPAMMSEQAKSPSRFKVVKVSPRSSRKGWKTCAPPNTLNRPQLEAPPPRTQIEHTSGFPTKNSPPAEGSPAYSTENRQKWREKLTISGRK